MATTYAFKNLKNPRNVLPGIAEFALIAPMSWFEPNGIKVPVAPFTNQGDSITVKTPHTFLTGKAFIKFALAPWKNKLTSKGAGDPGFQSSTNEVDIFLPGSYAEAHETLQNLLNVPLLAIVKDANCYENIYYQLGSESASARLSFDFDTGFAKAGEVKGFAAKLTYDGDLQFYKVSGGPATLSDVDAPTAGVVDDTANTFNWTNSPAFTAVGDYEVTTDSGATYTTATVKPIAGLTGAKAAGTVGVRVKATAGNGPSDTLFNATPYTV